MILKLVTTSELFIVIFICYHILKVFPYFRLINFFLQIIDFRNIYSLMISNPTTFSSIIALIGLTWILDPAVKIDIINLVLNILGSVISGGPYILIISVCFIIYLFTEPLINGIEKIIDIIEKELQPAIKYMSCLDKFPDGYSDCVASKVGIIDSSFTDATGKAITSTLVKQIKDEENFIEPHCTDTPTLMNFIKNNTTCSSKYVNESSNNPKLGFGCSNSKTANRILKSIEPSAADLTFRKDTRDKLTTYDQNTIIGCDSFINIASIFPKCKDAYSTIRNTAITGKPPYTVPDNLDNTTYSTVVGCTQDNTLKKLTAGIMAGASSTFKTKKMSTTDKIGAAFGIGK